MLQKLWVLVPRKDDLYIHTYEYTYIRVEFVETDRDEDVKKGGLVGRN